MQQNKVYLIERILSFLTYVTAGGVGVLWLIIAAVLKKHVTPFLMYHILQSFFIMITYFIILELCKLVYIILYRIPLINAIPYYINMPVFMGFSIIEIITTTIILYFAITAFMGKYSYFPWISDIINKNLGNK